MTDSDHWIEDWLSPSRLAVYLADAAGDRGLALARYDWNARVSAAFHHDLAHVEVGLRNAYDRALSFHDQPGDLHWVYAPRRHFPEQLRSGRGGSYDANATTRSKIEQAIKQAQESSGSQHPAPGKVIAELSFGFWSYLSVNRHDQLWRTHLYRAFTRGTQRVTVRDQVDSLHKLRNRVAHHEPLLRQDLVSRHREILYVAALVSVPLRDHIADRSMVPAVLADRP